VFIIETPRIRHNDIVDMSQCCALHWDSVHQVSSGLKYPFMT